MKDREKCVNRFCADARSIFSHRDDDDDDNAYVVLCKLSSNNALNTSAHVTRLRASN